MRLPSAWLRSMHFTIILRSQRAAGVAIGDSMHVEDRIYDPFIMSQNEIRGKKVTDFGSFSVYRDACLNLYAK